MAVAGRLRSSTALGLRQTAWRAGETTQWQHVRCMSAIDRATNARAKREQSRKTGLRQEQSVMGGTDLQNEILIPSTWVRPPLGRFPRSPSYLYHYLFTKGRDFLGRLGMKWSSKPGLFKPALYKPNTSKIVPMAKAMHVAMYEALARGDKAALRKTCGAVLADRFAATIDSRPPGRRYGWELVRYNWTMPWRYPRIMDHKLTPLQRDPRLSDNAHPPVLRQVVVTIASRQRRVEYDYGKQGGGRVVPGSEKEVDVVENVVLSQPLDRDTWVPKADWKIISLIGETTPEKWREDKELMESMERLHAQQTRNRIGL
ncbi:hypothetical protein NKR19_g3137 [Coniochaeta hoffmannii]|uniref:Tim44-like domain-containing protein n=1 Tax=Coniochaeta hoffmannii TaxID=91930 RepID=A0AA38S971_9PEZI|nr:hypothetical protein NKR19_g3137 [Coniochaeta hoffmannii]